MKKKVPDLDSEAEEKSTDDVGIASRRERSPNYPSILFDDALDRTKKIYEKEKQHAVSPEIAVKDMGLAGLNGRARVILGAMKQYGLLVSVGNQIRVTDDAAYVIVYPEGDLKRATLLQQLPLRPKVFQDLLVKFGASLPSDANVAAHLQFEMGFTAEACPTLLKAFKHAVEVSGVDGKAGSTETGAINLNQETPMSQFAPPPLGTAFTPPGKPPPAPPALHSRAWDLGDNTVMQVAIPMRLTKRNVQKLKKYVEVLAAEAEISWDEGEAT